jgi:hypothetical protein
VMVDNYLMEDEIMFDILFDDDDDTTVGAVASVLHLMAQDDDSSDEEMEEKKAKRKWGGSVPGKRANKDRDFACADAHIRKQYFSGEDSTYDEGDFERRFVMSRKIFCQIYDKLKNTPHFSQKTDAVGHLGISSMCRIVACLHVLA